MTSVNTQQPTSYGLSDIGLVRGNNEDSFRCLPEINTWVVCDGVGGEVSGEMASQIAVDTIAKAVKAGHSVTEAIQQAHRAIHDRVIKLPQARGMATTAIVLRLIAFEYEIAWVGDSRGYLFDGHSLKQLTTDHSLVQKLVETGQISSEQAMVHPKKNLITQSLGMDSELKLTIDRVTGTLYKGQTLLMCSDGLNSELSDQVIEKECLKTTDISLLTKNLIQASNKSGGRDNISVVLVQAPDSAPESAPKSAPHRKHWLRLLLGIVIALVIFGITRGLGGS